MNVDTREPWAHMSTPETQADHDLRDEFEAARDKLYEYAGALDEIRDRWHAWRTEFRANMKAGAPDDGDDD